MENEHDINTIKRNAFMENESRRILNKVMPIIIEEFKPYLNKKVLKIDNSLLKEIKDNSILKTFKEKETISPLIKGDCATINNLYIDTNDYSLSIKLTLCFNGGNYENNSAYCYYYENFSYICEIDKKKVKKVYEYENKEEINEDDEIKVYIKSKRLKDELNLELSKFKLYQSKDLIK